LELRLGGREGPLRSTRRRGRQRRGPLQKGGGVGQTSPRLGTSGGALELGGDILVGAGGCLGHVPSAPVRVGLGVGRIRQRSVHPTPFIGRSHPVGRRTHKRMAKANPGVDLDRRG
jgi:hypothetical protein